MDPDDITRAYFFDVNNTRQWHVLVWTEASEWEGPMNEDGLAFARKLAKAKYRHFDDRIALAELLERRKLSQSYTMAERRAALRLSREQSSLGIDLAAAVQVSELPTARKVRHGVDAAEAAADEAAAFVDDLDDIPIAADPGFYDDVLEDL